MTRNVEGEGGAGDGRLGTFNLQNHVQVQCTDHQAITIRRTYRRALSTLPFIILEREHLSILPLILSLFVPAGIVIKPKISMLLIKC